MFDFIFKLKIIILKKQQHDELKLQSSESNGIFHHDHINKGNNNLNNLFNNSKRKTMKTKFFSFPTDKKLIGQNLYSVQLASYDKNTLFEDLKTLVVSDKDNKRIYLWDISNIFLSPTVSDKKSFYVDKQDNIVNAISYQITKAPGYDVEKLTDNVISTIKEFEKANPALKIVESSSQKETIQATYKLFLENFFETGWLNHPWEIHFDFVLNWFCRHRYLFFH